MRTSNECLKYHGEGNYAIYFVHIAHAMYSGIRVVHIFRCICWIFDFIQLTKTSQRALLHGWWRRATSDVGTYLRHSLYATTFIAFLRAIDFLFIFNALPLACAVCAGAVLSCWATFMRTAYDPFRCNRLCFSHLSCENPAAMQEGWVLFIHLFKIALFIERVAGEWRLIDGHKNCGIIKTAQRSFSLSCGTFIHL